MLILPFVIHPMVYANALLTQSPKSPWSKILPKFVILIVYTVFSGLLVFTYNLSLLSIG